MLSMVDKNLLDLERKINYKFDTRSLLRKALTHKSFSKNNNEKLEFLGDSILNFSISSFIFSEENVLDEGQLSRIRSNLVNQNTLIKVARFISLDKYLYVGTALKPKNGYIKNSIVADSLEAIFGAVCLDGGGNRATEVILNLYKKVLLKDISLRQIDLRDPKGELQELMQGLGLALPVYSVLEITGPEHAPVYKVESSVNICDEPAMELKKVVCRGDGGSIKSAEQSAAKFLLDKLRSLDIKKSY